MTQALIDRLPVARAKPASVKRLGKRNVSASELARHLDCSRTYIQKLEAEGVLHRDAGGFDLDASRIAYLQYLRRERQQSPRSEADAAFQRAKTRMLEIKIAKQERILMNTDEALFWIETLVGLFRSRLHSLPARIGGRDLQERRRIDLICNEILAEIADEANKRAAEMERELGITIDDYPAAP